MTSQALASVLEGAISLFGGLYCTLLGFRVLGKKPGQSRDRDQGYNRYGRLMKGLGPAVMIFGLFLMVPAFTSHSNASAPELPPSETVEQSDLVPLAVGNRWVYRMPGSRMEMRVAAHEKIGQVMSARIEVSVEGVQATGNEHQTLSDGSLYQTATNGRLMDPPMCLLLNPRSGAGEWEYASRNGAIRCRSRSSSNVPVAVPAGKYENAILVEMESTDARGTSHRSFWYVPGIGPVKFLFQVGGEQRLGELERFEGSK